jgi:predicted PurR-regulated permease PerM
VSADAKTHPDRSADRRFKLNLHDPMPLSDPSAFWVPVGQAANIVMCIVLLGAVLYFARPVVLPVLAAVAVGLTVGPVTAQAARRGVPEWVPALAVVVVLLCAAYLAAILLVQPASQLINRSAEFSTAIKDKVQILDRPLAAFRELHGALASSGKSGVTVDVNQTNIIESLVTVITPAAVQFVIQLVLFFGTLFFFVLGRTGFRQYVVSLFAQRDARLRMLKILNDVEENLSGYLIVVTAINLSLGVVTTLMAYALGLPSPLLWGALAFTLNYIPYVGPGIMYVILFAIGLLTYPTLWGALLPPGIFALITLIEGQFITPTILGRKLLMVHPLTVFLTIAFLAWLWGPIGAFLAMPILIVATVTLNHLYPARRDALPG